MSSKSETGHAKNVYNFQDLIMHVDSLGQAYNPSKNELKISNLKIQYKSAAESLLALASAMPHYQQAVDAREIAFSSLSKLVTRALNMYKASVLNQPEVESAVSVSKKIRGFKASKPKPAQEGNDC